MKSGLEYFPLDCNIDIKLQLIEAEFGITGFGVVVKLFQKIYGEQGYYIEWTKEVALLFSRNIGLGNNVVSEIVEASINRGIFSKKHFEEYNILTSRGIQKRYLEAVIRRKNVSMKKEYLLVSNIEKYKNVDISSENVCKNQKNEYISKQSKVKESKVKESRVEEYTTAAAFLQENFCKILSSSEIQKLYEAVDEFGLDIVKLAITETVLNDVRAWKYTQTILDNWRSKGVKTLEQAELQAKKFKNKPEEGRIKQLD